MKKILALILLSLLVFATPAFAVDVDFDLDDDDKIDTIFLDFSWDITGAVECDGAGACTQAEYEDLSNYNALDPDYLTGDTTDDNLIDVAVINTTALKVTLSTDDLWTLSGRSEGSQHLGTFTGSTIDDNLTIKAAFQDLETYIESLGGGHDPVTLGTTLNSNLLGITTQQLTLDSQAINTVFAGPASGGSAAPAFRALVAADIPNLSATYQTILTNEAGLYSALSDVSQFYEPGDTMQVGSGTSLPGTCTTGEFFIDTDADTDGTMYICVNTDTWKDVDDDGSTGSDVLAKVSSNETDADYLVNQISSTNGEIDVSESGTGDETLNIDIDVTPSDGYATLEISDDAIQVKYKSDDFNESAANGLEIDYTNGQAAATGVKGFLTGTDWDTFNAKESETHASEHAVGAADPVFPADPGFNGIFTWDDTAGITEWGTSADLSYDGANWSVVDDSHSHVYSNIDAFTEANLYTLLSDVSQFYEPGDAASFSSVSFTDEDASPSAAGQLKYDNTIPGLVDGGLVFYDDDEVQLIVSVPMDNFGTGPTDDYVVAYDAINDEHYYVEMGGVGGNTKFNLIADADADGEIALLGFEQTITTTIDEAGGAAITIKHTDSDGLANDTYLIEFIHANDGDAQAHFMRGLDNTSNELWSIAYDGTATFKAVQTSGSDNPGFTARDLQNPGADLEIGKIYWNYLTGADGAEDGGIYLQVMVAGTERTIFEYDADTEAITMGDDATGEDLEWDFDTGVGNKISVDTNTGADEIDFNSINIKTDQFESDIATGTPPLIVASTTLVTNLNADTVDGESASAIVTAARVGAISANLDDTDASVEWEYAADLDSTGAVDEAELAALKGLTFADASIIQLTGPAAAAVLTSGGNNYFLTSTSDNSALEFKTPANALAALGISATASEINTPLDGALVTLTEFQELETIGDTTISANQWALLGGLAETLTAAELNILDGVTGVTAAELSYIGDVTGLIQAQLNAKQATVTEGSLADSVIVSADIKNGEVAPADLSTAARTQTQCIYIEDPDATDDLKSIWYTPVAVTLTQIWAESDQTVTFMLQVDDGTPADCDSVDLAPAAGEASDTALNGDATMAAGDRLDIDLVSVTNTPTWVSICWSYTAD